VVSQVSTGTLVVNPYVPPVNIPPTMNYKNATLSGSIVNNNNLTIYFIVTDPDTDASDVELWYNLNNGGAQLATGSMSGSLVSGGEVYLNLDLTNFTDGNNISYEFWIHDKIANANSNVLS
jgi:hypothetical protein